MAYKPLNVDVSKSLDFCAYVCAGPTTLDETFAPAKRRPLLSRKSKRLTLNATHIARIHRVVPDSGVPLGLELNTDADYLDWVDKVVRSSSKSSGPVLLFAYGSLIWKPEIEHIGEELSVARGWHRAFCFRMPRFRGTPEEPGLMMALDRGGQCGGMIYHLSPSDLVGQLNRLFRREFTSKPVNSMPRWITVETNSGKTTALAFVMNRASPLYAGRLSLDAVADVLVRACGHWGTGAEYLLNTVTHLEAKGIHDRNLWKLQRLVAEKIDRLHAV
jgi:glutathione-specific gamma-glutamylcyclotransferase